MHLYQFMWMPLDANCYCIHSLNNFTTTLMWETGKSFLISLLHLQTSLYRQTEIRSRNLISHINNRSFGSLCVSCLVIGPMRLQTKLLVISWYTKIQLSFYFIFFLLFSRSPASDKFAPNNSYTNNSWSARKLYSQWTWIWLLLSALE